MKNGLKKQKISIMLRWKPGLSRKGSSLNLVIIWSEFKQINWVTTTGFEPTTT